MWKKIALRGSIAVAAIAVAVALVPAGAARFHLGRTNPVAATGATTVTFSPATNPAFKVNDGFTACESERTGRLWQATTITATSVRDDQTDEVRVVLAGVTVSLPAPGFSATVPTTQNFNCSSLSDTNLPYTAKSYKNGNAQGGPDASSFGSYAVTKID